MLRDAEGAGCSAVDIRRSGQVSSTSRCDVGHEMVKKRGRVIKAKNRIT